MTTYRPHVFLTDQDRKELALLVHQAARRSPDGPRLVELFGGLLADVQYERCRVVNLDRRLSQARAVGEPPAEDRRSGAWSWWVPSER